MGGRGSGSNKGEWNFFHISLIGKGLEKEKYENILKELLFNSKSN